MNLHRDAQGFYKLGAKCSGDNKSAGSLGNLFQPLLDLLKFITILLAFSTRVKFLKNSLNNCSSINWCTTIHTTIWAYHLYSIPFLCYIHFGLHAGLWGFQAKNCILLLVWSPTWKKEGGWVVSFNFVETMAWLFSFLILLYCFVFSCILFASPNLSCCLLLTFPLVVLPIFIPCKYNTYSCSFSSSIGKIHRHFPYIFFLLS